MPSVLAVSTPPERGGRRGRRREEGEGERERGGRGGGGVSYISHKPLYITTVEPENLASTLIWRFG